MKEEKNADKNKQEHPNLDSSAPVSEMKLLHPTDYTSLDVIFRVLRNKFTSWTLSVTILLNYWSFPGCSIPITSFYSMKPMHLHRKLPTVGSFPTHKSEFQAYVFGALYLPGFIVSILS